ncbi:sciellin isoform X2 [Nematolebias whitei]|uniref:sciellin isoform X2 n=1 Tax=Nematolebias whitei TaxID=451745 RepID=UPI00189BB61A|nr:sciellin isoform X2 [Nematolebias whitei]
MSRYSASSKSLLKDNSWIKKLDDEDEAVDSSELDPAKGTTKPASVLALSKRFGGGQDDLKTSSVSSTRTSTSYTKRYSSGKMDTPSSFTTTVKDEPKTSTTTTTVTRNGSTTETTTITSSQTIKSPVTKSADPFTERVKSSSKDSQYSTYSPTRTTKVAEQSITTTKDAEDKLLDTLLQSPSKDDFSSPNSKMTTQTVTVKSSADADAEDKLYDSLIPRSLKNNGSDSKSTITSSETVTVKSSYDDAEDDYIRRSIRDDSTNIKSSVTSTETWTIKSTSIRDIKSTSPTKTSSEPEDALYDSLLPKAITSPVSTTKRDVIITESSRGRESPTLTTPTSTRTSSYSSYTDDIPSTRTNSYSDSYSKTYSYSRPDSSSYEYTSITSSSLHSSPSYKSSWSDDSQTDSIYSKSSNKSLYQTPERTVLEKDLCTVCRKPFTGDAKMVLDDVSINCHAACFKCQVCNSSLSNLKAGDSMWVYKRMVHCENCFETTRDKWRR